MIQVSNHLLTWFTGILASWHLWATVALLVQERCETVLSPWDWQSKPYLR